MGFRRKLKYFLVQSLKISNTEVIKILNSGEVLINGKVNKSANLEIEPEDEIIFGSKVLQTSKKFKYLSFYKPRGIETTLNPDIKEGLLPYLPFFDVFPIGRLDKESEGLLLLTDDGRVYDKILREENKATKEYLVSVEPILSSDFLAQMASGVNIMGKFTLPCHLTMINSNTFTIALIQGRNRQIRRMCYKLGFKVTRLIRTRIGNVNLGDLNPLEWRIENDKFV
jgi:23S rRNA pseudouridine2604 synthase